MNVRAMIQLPFVANESSITPHHTSPGLEKARNFPITPNFEAKAILLIEECTYQILGK